MKSICVYCSSSDMISDLYFKTAEKIGKLIGEKKYTLVYGGGKVGLMGKTAKSVLAHGGKVIGVIPEALNKDHIALPDTDEFIVTPDMRERKKTMEEKSHAFIALPGGFGTIEEISEIITLKQLQYHNKPIVILNKNNFYDGLLSQFEKSFEEKFIKENMRNLYFITDCENEAINYIDNYKEEKITEKWF